MSADASSSGAQAQAGTDSAGNPFAAGLGASLGFFQDWMKAAGSAMPGMPSAGGGSQSPTGSTLGAMGSLGSWTMPTLDPQELEKRITDLKTVQFWLEQNARMIAMTIQGLEVQRMTLSTLKGMNVSMDALRESLKARAKPTEEPAAASKAEPEAAPHAEAGGQGINPMQWWDTLTQQFTQLASQATQAGVDVGTAASNTMAQAAASATAAATSAATSAAEAVQTAAQAAPAKRGAAKGAAAHPPKRKPSGGQAD